MMKITLKQARVGVGMTQEEVSAEMGVHQNTVSRWEALPETVPAGSVAKLLRLYKVNFEDVIFLRNETTNVN